MEFFRVAFSWFLSSPRGASVQAVDARNESEKKRKKTKKPTAGGSNNNLEHGRILPAVIGEALAKEARSLTLCAQHTPHSDTGLDWTAVTRKAPLATSKAK